MMGPFHKLAHMGIDPRPSAYKAKTDPVAAVFIRDYYLM